MVPHPRAPLGPGNLRALNAPRPLLVATGPDDLPAAVRREGWPAPRPVSRVLDHWRLDDEWWRERPIARLYYTVAVAGGLTLTLYRDLAGDSWYEQRG